MGVLEDFVSWLFYKVRGEDYLTVREVKEESVVVSLKDRVLYGMEVTSNTDVVETLAEQNVQVLKGLVAQTTAGEAGKGNNGLLHVVVHRNKELNTGSLITKVYYFSHNKELLATLNQLTGNKHFKWLTGAQLTNVLASLLHVKVPYYLGSDYKVYRSGNYFPENFKGPSEKAFFAIAKEVPPDVKVFQGVAYKGTNPRWDLSLQWEGALWITLDFSDQMPYLKMKKEQAVYQKGFRNMIEKVEKNERDYVGISATFFTRMKGEEVYGLVLHLFNYLGFEALEKSFLRDVLARSTPILQRDFDFHFFTTPDLACKYLIYQFEKNTIPKNVIVYGKNQYSDYVAFNMFEECKNPHCAILGPSGSGKSVFVQDLEKTALKVSIRDLLEKKGVSLPKVRIRHFDKGYSAELFFRLLKENGAPVALYSVDPAKLRFNPCEIEEQSDYDFVIWLLNSILEVEETEFIRGLEANFLRQALRAVKENEKYRFFDNRPINVLLNFPGLENLYEELIRKGYDSRTLIREVREPEYDFLHQPVIGDVARYLRNLNTSKMSKDEVTAYEKLLSKMEVLTKIDVIKSPAPFSVKTMPFFYMDYDKLQSSRYFVPIFLYIIKKIMKVDKFEKDEDEAVFFVIDEVRNLFSNSAFIETLTILIREARKFKISVIYITQDVTDIPSDVLRSIDTKILLLAGTTNQRTAFMSSVKDHLKLPEKAVKDVEHLYVNVSMGGRGAVVWFEKGVFTLKVELTAEEHMVFDSMRRSIQLSDGTVIVKEAFAKREAHSSV